jgi:tetratricopeptide (TPR) repeat protein
MLAARALAAGRYADAAQLYREALGEAPGKMELHYGLAVASSYLDLRDDAIREFRWVLQYGPPSTAEVEASRQWLIRAGALPPAAYAAAKPTAPEKERTAGNASLEGRAVFAEGGQTPQPMTRQQLFLVGQPNSPTQRERYNLRTDEHGNFKFPDVVPGPYKLTNRVAGQPTWRMRVDLKASEVKVLELTPANSVASLDDFPEPQAEAKQ